MNAVAVRTAGRYFGVWGAIVLFVVLLSFLFTILGTISCAVLAGMMMGAFKGAKWFSVSVSLVFPAVIFGLARGAKVELAPQQILLLAALCFGTFWATYVVSAYLFFFEQQGRKASRIPVAVRHPGTLAQDGQAAEESCAPAEEPPGWTEPAGALCLEQLQGNWVCEASSPDRPPGKRVIQIKQAKVELKAIDTRGVITLLGEGALTLQSAGPAASLGAPQGASAPADFIVGL
jgi:hypothetical protein